MPALREFLLCRFNGPVKTSGPVRVEINCRPSSVAALCRVKSLITSKCLSVCLHTRRTANGGGVQDGDPSPPPPPLPSTPPHRSDQLPPLSTLCSHCPASASVRARSAPTHPSELTQSRLPPGFDVCFPRSRKDEPCEIPLT